MRLWDFFMFMSMSAENHRLEASLSLSFIERWYFTCLSFFAYQDKPPARWKKENYILGIMKAVKQWCVQHCLRWTHLIWASESDPLCSRHSRVLFLQSISASSIFFLKNWKAKWGWLAETKISADLICSAFNSRTDAFLKWIFTSVSCWAQ